MPADVRFDAASAVIVRHADLESLGGALPIAAEGGGMSQQATHSLDYDSRSREWEEKGGIDRELTDEDKELSAMSRQLDYVARMGGFSEKGADQMVDCTYFGQHGPVSREEIEADMLECGGCFMRSIVTVDRQNAAMLGLDTKAGFESLLRSTWAKSIVGEQGRTLADGTKAPGVQGWGVTENVHDVRWIANYHTDQANNLHCHITTWFAGGARRFNEPGWTVTAAATRGQKEIIYREAYRNPMRDRVYPAKDYARAMAVAQAKAELGVPEAPRERKRLERLGEKVGRVPDPRRTLEGKDLERVSQKVRKMQEVYEKGEGRKARSYKLEAAARDVHKELMERSVPYKEYVDEYRAHIGVMADAKGLALPERDPENGAEPGQTAGQEAAESRTGDAREVIAHERDRYVRSQMDELVRHRIVPAIETVASVDRMVREVAKEPMAQILPPKQIAQAVREAAPAAEAKALLAENKAPELAEKVMQVPAVRMAVSVAAAEAKQELDRSGRDVPLEKVEHTVREQVQQKVTSWLERFGERSIDREQSREVAHVVRDALRSLRTPPVEAAIRDSGVSLGLSKGESMQVAQAVVDVAMMQKASYPKEEVAARAEQAAEVIVSSPVVQGMIERAAKSVAASQGMTAQDAHEKVAEKVKAQVTHQVEQKAPEVQPMASQAMMSQPIPPPAIAQPMGIGGSLGNMIASIASGLAGQAAKQQVRKAGRTESIDQRELDVGQERTR